MIFSVKNSEKSLAPESDSSLLKPFKRMELGAVLVAKSHVDNSL